ncbi:hypothetical protein AVDCRST_MAG82-2137, partial [uncultured Rubrobacteraceae bacterium]
GRFVLRYRGPCDIAIHKRSGRRCPGSGYRRVPRERVSEGRFGKVRQPGEEPLAGGQFGRGDQGRAGPQCALPGDPRPDGPGGRVESGPDGGLQVLGLHVPAPRAIRPRLLARRGGFLV